MALEADFLDKLRPLHPRRVAEILASDDRPKGKFVWYIENELPPADLFCYLWTRFGPPNGIQNLLRTDDSDNLVHWNWTIGYGEGLLEIQGMNFSTFVCFMGDTGVDASDVDDFVAKVRGDFQNHGTGMGEVRRSLESWTEFVNPYYRVRRATRNLMEELTALKISDMVEPPSLLSSISEGTSADVRSQWKDALDRLHRAYGLCFGIRSMLPVAGEAFVNLILFVLMRKELKSNARLRDNALRQPIDVRVGRLHVDCYGFKKGIDVSSGVWKKFHTLMNARNDLLHGNVAMDKLKFNDVYFIGKVPVFKTYRSMWDRSVGVRKKSIGIAEVKDDVKTVDEFCEHVMSCLDEKIRPAVELMCSRGELGINKENGRVGVLFPEHLVDARMGSDSAAKDKRT